VPRGINVIALAALAWLVAYLLPAAGQPAAKSAAEKSAASFLSGIQQLDPGQVYDLNLAPRGKNAVSKPTFSQWVNVFKIQSGGPAQSRLLVGSTPMMQLQTGETGDFYYVRYRETFSSEPFFADVMLEQIDGQWLVIWFNYMPAPAQP
jgi:hypothetical protein